MNPGEFEYRDDVIHQSDWESVYQALEKMGARKPKEIMLDIHATIGTAMDRMRAGQVMVNSTVENRQQKVQEAAITLLNEMQEAGMPMNLGAYLHDEDVMPGECFRFSTHNWCIQQLLEAVTEEVERQKKEPLMERLQGANVEFRYLIRTVEQCLWSEFGRSSPALVNRIVSYYFPNSDHDQDAVNKMLLRGFHWT